MLSPVEHARWRERSRLVRLHRLWRTRRPVTFTEKVQYKMLRDHRTLLVTFADKVAVRDYVTAAIGPGYLPEAYGVVSDPGQLRSVARPAAYVVKPSHGSGAVIVVSPDAPADAVLPPPQYSWVYRQVRPEAVDEDHLEQIGRHWLTQLYGQGPNREWAYGPVPRRILVEELLTCADRSIPEDYKLFVFHERCHFVQVDAGRFGRRTQDFYLPDWQRLELSGGLPWAATSPPKPERLEEMIDLAERLARGTDFVRVDLYGLADRVVFGELTSYPAGGHSPFKPETFNTEFGRPWTVPRRYR
jgi:hypothetical protein